MLCERKWAPEWVRYEKNNEERDVEENCVECVSVCCLPHRDRSLALAAAATAALEKAYGAASS